MYSKGKGSAPKGGGPNMGKGCTPDGKGPNMGKGKGAVPSGKGPHVGKGGKEPGISAKGNKKGPPVKGKK